MPVVGTAGHVDHGKSTLVEALTGRDPDRWAEEKRRGLTIDLGFAWTTLGDGREVSFVDVPGHERFIKNMLAGTEAIDVALLVVAADEGWMPQSEEHLAVLDLLEVEHGVVALTKVDRVDQETVELAQLEVEERLAGTRLAGSPVVPVAAPAAVGIEPLRAALTAAVAARGPIPDLGRARLWIDRAFTIAGAGTVVTGTLLDGTVAVGDRLLILPGPREVRVRGIQSHEREEPSVGPGTRTALNLAGLDRAEVGRGDMIGRPDQWEPAARLLLAVRRARYVEEPLDDRGAYHLHLGSGAWPVRLRLVGEDGHWQGALVELPGPLPVAMGDRLVLREVGRRLVVAGGRVLAPDPPRRTREAGAAFGELLPLVDADPSRRAQALLELRGRDHPARLAAHSGGGQVEQATIAGRVALAPEEASRLSKLAERLVDRYHRDNPLRPGIPKASLASRMGLEPDLVDALVAVTPGVEDRGQVVAAADFRADLTSAQRARWEQAEQRLHQAGLAVPRVKELDIDQELLHALLRDGRLVRVSDDLVYLPDELARLQERLAELAQPFTVAQFRDAFQISRKYAVPLLEWLDDRGVTVRAGDVRRLR